MEGARPGSPWSDARSIRPRRTRGPWIDRHDRPAGRPDASGPGASCSTAAEGRPFADLPPRTALSDRASLLRPPARGSPRDDAAGLSRLPGWRRIPQLLPGRRVPRQSGWRRVPRPDGRWRIPRLSGWRLSRWPGWRSVPRPHGGRRRGWRPRARRSSLDPSAPVSPFELVGSFCGSDVARALPHIAGGRRCFRWKVRGDGGDVAPRDRLSASPVPRPSPSRPRSAKERLIRAPS